MCVEADVVWIAGGGGGVAGGAVVGVALAEVWKLVLPQSVPFKYVGRLDPSVQHVDGLTAHKKLQCSLSARGPGRSQSQACCVLTEKGMRAVVEVLAHECGW